MIASKRDVNTKNGCCREAMPIRHFLAPKQCDFGVSDFSLWVSVESIATLFFSKMLCIIGFILIFAYVQ